MSTDKHTHTVPSTITVIFEKQSHPSTITSLLNTTYKAGHGLAPPPSPALTEIRLWLILTKHTSILSHFHFPLLCPCTLLPQSLCIYLSSPFGAPFPFSSPGKYLLICHFLREAFPDYLVIDSQSTMYPPSSAFRDANLHLFGRLCDQCSFPK